MGLRESPWAQWLLLVVAVLIICSTPASCRSISQLNDLKVNKIQDTTGAKRMTEEETSDAKSEIAKSKSSSRVMQQSNKLTTLLLLTQKSDPCEECFSIKNVTIGTVKNVSVPFIIRDNSLMQPDKANSTQGPWPIGPREMPINPNNARGTLNDNLVSGFKSPHLTVSSLHSNNLQIMSNWMADAAPSPAEGAAVASSFPFSSSSSSSSSSDDEEVVVLATAVKASASAGAIEIDDDEEQIYRPNNSYFSLQEDLLILNENFSVNSTWREGSNNSATREDIDESTNFTDTQWQEKQFTITIQHPILAGVLGIMCFFVIFGNVLVMVAIKRERALQSITNYFVVSLAAADCLVGLVVMPFSVIHEVLNKKWIFNQDFCDLWHSFDVLGSTASILNLCVISMDRYWAITDPLAYPVIMTPGRAKKLIALVWSCSSIISFPAIVWWRSVSPDRESEYQCTFTDDAGYLVFSSIISFYGPLSVMIYVYYRIYKAAVEQTRSLKTGSKQIQTPGLPYGITNGSSAQAGLTGDSENGPVVLRIHRGGFTSLSAVLEQQQQMQQQKCKGRKKSFWSAGRKGEKGENNMSNIAEVAAKAAVAASAITASGTQPARIVEEPKVPQSKSKLAPCSSVKSSTSTTSGTSNHGDGPASASTCLKSPGQPSETRRDPGLERAASGGGGGGIERSQQRNFKTWSMGKKFSKLAKERKAAKTLGIVMGVFILCWLPFFVTNILMGVCPNTCISDPELVGSIVTWLGWLNSGMNPVIYACWSKEFRLAFKRILFDCFHCHRYFCCCFFLSCCPSCLCPSTDHLMNRFQRQPAYRSTAYYSSPAAIAAATASASRFTRNNHQSNVKSATSQGKQSIKKKKHSPSPSPSDRCTSGFHEGNLPCVHNISLGGKGTNLPVSSNTKNASSSPGEKIELNQLKVCTSQVKEDDSYEHHIKHNKHQHQNEQHEVQVASATFGQFNDEIHQQLHEVHEIYETHAHDSHMRLDTSSGPCNSRPGLECTSASCECISVTCVLESSLETAIASLDDQPGEETVKEKEEEEEEGEGEEKGEEDDYDEDGGEEEEVHEEGEEEEVALQRGAINDETKPSDVYLHLHQEQQSPRFTDITSSSISGITSIKSQSQSIHVTSHAAKCGTGNSVSNEQNSQENVYFVSQQSPEQLTSSPPHPSILASSQVERPQGQSGEKALPVATAKLKLAVPDVPSAVAGETTFATSTTSGKSDFDSCNSLFPSQISQLMPSTLLTRQEACRVEEYHYDSAKDTLVSLDTCLGTTGHSHLCHHTSPDSVTLKIIHESASTNSPNSPDDSINELYQV